MNLQNNMVEVLLPCPNLRIYGILIRLNANKSTIKHNTHRRNGWRSTYHTVPDACDLTDAEPGADEHHCLHGGVLQQKYSDSVTVNNIYKISYRQ